MTHTIFVYIYFRMLPPQSQAQQATRLNTTADTTVSMQDQDSDELQEVIEVQILPQVRAKS